MWKSTAGNTASTPLTKAAEEDDWETDPNYVNDVSEKDQRWAAGTKESSATTAPINLNHLSKQVINQNEADVKKNWESLNGKDIKNSYGVDKNKKI